MLHVSIYMLILGFLLCFISYVYGCSKFKTLHFHKFRVKVSSIYLNRDVLVNFEVEFIFPY
jgi:hypothetical protein